MHRLRGRIELEEVRRLRMCAKPDVELAALGAVERAPHAVLALAAAGEPVRLDGDDRRRGGLGFGLGERVQCSHQHGHNYKSHEQHEALLSFQTPPILSATSRLDNLQLYPSTTARSVTMIV